MTYELKTFRNRVIIDFDSDTEEQASAIFHKLSEAVDAAEGCRWKGAEMDTHKHDKSEHLSNP